MIDNERARFCAFSVSGFVILLIVTSTAGAMQTQNLFLGSVPAGQATGTTLELSLKDVFERALKTKTGGPQRNPKRHRNTRTREIETWWCSPRAKPIFW